MKSGNNSTTHPVLRYYIYLDYRHYTIQNRLYQYFALSFITHSCGDSSWFLHASPLHSVDKPLVHALVIQAAKTKLPIHVVRCTCSCYSNYFFDERTMLTILYIRKYTLNKQYF